MEIEILTIGDEILSGNIIDTNTTYLADKLWMNGFEVAYHSAVRDDGKKIIEALRLAFSRAQIVLVTGGLGPTEDDLTMEMAAKAFNRKLVMDKQYLSYLEGLYRKWKRKMGENNKKQAKVIQGARTFLNLKGTAPGVAYKHGKTHFYFFPGVPSELKHLFEDYVLPEVRKLRRTDLAFESRLIKTFGAAESRLDAAVTDLYTGPLEIDKVRVGFRVSFPETFIKLSAWDSTPAKARGRLNRVIGKVQQRVGDYVYGEGDDTLESVVAGLLIRKRKTLSIAESCTGGLLCNRLTNISGSSSFLMNGVVSYSNRSKIKLLGVKSQTIRRFGAVSGECALEMAGGVRKILKTHFGIGVTGIAGPTGGTPEKPVGTVHIALASGRNSWEKGFHIPRSRLEFKTVASSLALDWLRRELLGMSELAFLYS